MPKSSIANGTPRAASVFIASSEAGSLPMPSRSVISRTSSAPSMRGRACSILVTKSGSRSCLAEMFTRRSPRRLRRA